MAARRIFPALCGALLGLLLPGCEPDSQIGRWDLSGCNCEVASVGASVLVRCGDTVCIDGRYQECVEYEAVDRGPCGARADLGPYGGGGGGGRERDGSGPADSGPCQPGGGSCSGNTFVPCEEGAPQQPCRALVCTPSGAGPQAGCLAPEGYFCDNYPCAPGLICAPDQHCRRPEDCEGACTPAGTRSCLTEQQPATCRVDADGCLAWRPESPCEHGQLCAAGSCEPFCAATAEPCPQWERCEDEAEGCVSTGLGGSPAGGFCDTHGDCAAAGARCANNQCMPRCSSDDDCVLLGLAACCDQPSRYGVCRTEAQGACRP